MYKRPENPPQRSILAMEYLRGLLGITSVAHRGVARPLGEWWEWRLYLQCQKWGSSGTYPQTPHQHPQHGIAHSQMHTATPSVLVGGLKATLGPAHAIHFASAPGTCVTLRSQWKNNQPENAINMTGSKCHRHEHGNPRGQVPDG